MSDPEMPPLVHDFTDHPVQLRALLALWDTSVAMLLERLDGVTDEEWTWRPPPTMRSLTWTAIHLGELGRLRSDWTTGSHSLRQEDLIHHGADMATVRDLYAAPEYAAPENGASR
jgi:hypothetical protein